MSILRYLQEGLLHENSDSLSKHFNNIGMRTEDVFELIEYHDSYKNLYPNYDNNDSDYESDYDDEYYYDTIEDAYKDVNDTLDMFNSLPNPIPIYRTIKVKSIDDINYDVLGDSWSFDKDSAINFASNQAMGNVLLSAKTKFDNVDWEKTLQLYYQFSGGYDGYDENEINIIDTDDVFDIKAEKI